jgi:hypothetical protein
VLLFNDIVVLAVKKKNKYQAKSGKITLRGSYVWEDRAVKFGFTLVGREAADKITVEAATEQEKASNQHARHDTTRHDTTRHDTTRHDTTRHDTHELIITFLCRRCGWTRCRRPWCNFRTTRSSADRRVPPPPVPPSPTNPISPLHCSARSGAPVAAPDAAFS